MAAQLAIDAVRLIRPLAIIRAKAEKMHARGNATKITLEAAFLASASEKQVTARASTCEIAIERGHTVSAAYVVCLCEMAEDGTLYARSAPSAAGG